MSQSVQKSIDDFILLTVIGKGCFGKILLVKQKYTQKVHAMKIIKKKLLNQDKKIQTIFTQRNLLIEFNHPFIIRIVSSFQNQKKFYFVLEYCPGGQLFNLLSIKGMFTQQQTKFYIAQVILALQYIHQKDIVYRDLKPENILIDKEGYIKLTDFGLSKKLKKNQVNNFSLSGMPQYMAPEILNHKKCGKAVDFWCLGSLMYEMLTGYVPFFSQNLNELYENIKNQQFQPDKQTNLSQSCLDLLKRLFIKSPENRLGMKDINQLKNHEWFSGINWQAVKSKKYRAPFVPLLQGEDDTSYFCPQITESIVNSMTSYDESNCQDPLYDDAKFQGFDYQGDEESDEEKKNKVELYQQRKNSRSNEKKNFQSELQ